MRYLIVKEAPPYVAPPVEDGMEAPTPPTQAELNMLRALELSEKIWGVKRPNPPAGTVTKRYTNCIQHNDGRVALVVLGEATTITIDGEDVTSYSDAMPVHPDADTAALADAVGDAVTPDEQAAMQAKLEAAKGQSASPLQFATETPSLSLRLKTHEEMVADGWFPDPAI